MAFGQTVVDLTWGKWLSGIRPDVLADWPMIAGRAGVKKGPDACNAMNINKKNWSSRYDCNILFQSWVTVVPTGYMPRCRIIFQRPDSEGDAPNRVEWGRYSPFVTI